MAYNRFTRHQRAVGYTILARVHNVLRGSETEEELNERLQALHGDISGNYVQPDERYLDDSRKLKASVSQKGKRKPKPKSAAAKGGPTKRQRGGTLPSAEREQVDPPLSVDLHVNLSKRDEASAAIAQDMEGDTFEIQKFCSYDAAKYELLVVWEGTDGEPVGQCAFNLHHDLGDVTFERLCSEADIDPFLVKSSSGIGAAAGVKVRHSGTVYGEPHTHTHPPQPTQADGPSAPMHRSTPV